MSELYDGEIKWEPISSPGSENMRCSRYEARGIAVRLGAVEARQMILRQRDWFNGGYKESLFHQHEHYFGEDGREICYHSTISDCLTKMSRDWSPSIKEGHAVVDQWIMDRLVRIKQAEEQQAEKVMNGL